ncbi:hypothetical protein [Streptomyces sp. ID05-18]|uniref:hypothetical protein n=1 Tax=Streptomyces sp. ID05-18 TaxID=3028662 RepID=UPI0029A32ACF|nr:hypothetical protein [Streptomyces sp. ID05-18]MDX3488315.1 hypothetical protein [Streptomyces sp. ID05-18]
MFFGKNGGDDADGNGDRDEAPSGLTMLHQAMLHTSTTLSETLDRGLTDVKSTNTDAHAAVTKELARMTRALQDAQKLLPLPYSARDSNRDSATAEQVHQLRDLVTAVQATLLDVAQDVTSLASVPVPAMATTGDGNGYDRPPAETAHAGRPLLDGVPEQRADSITMGGPAAGEGPAPADGADTAGAPAVEPDTAVESGPGDEAGPQPGPETEAPLTREQVAEAIREVLAEKAQAPLTRDQVADVVREVVAQELAPLTAALPRLEADDAPSAVSELGGQITALRAEVAGLVERLPAVQQGEAEEQEQPVADPEHSRVLTQAAGISSAVLVCHRDLWELLSGWAGGHPHFRMPPQIADQGENRIAADISGRSLIAVLISLSRLRHTAAEGDGDRELAEAVYQRIGNSLAALSPDEGPLVTITLDDRTPRTGDISDS